MTRPAGPVLGNLGEGFLLGLAQPVAGVDTVEAGQHEMEEDTGCADASASHVGRDSRGEPAVDVGFGAVVEPQLDAGADAVAQGGADVVPASGGQDEMHTDAETAGGDLGDVRLRALELGPQRPPVVDQQEDIGCP